jgi:hypothetical protein
MARKMTHLDIGRGKESRRKRENKDGKKIRDENNTNNERHNEE